MCKGTVCFSWHLLLPMESCERQRCTHGPARVDLSRLYLFEEGCRRFPHLILAVACSVSRSYGQHWLAASGGMLTTYDAYMYSESQTFLCVQSSPPVAETRAGQKLPLIEFRYDTTCVRYSHATSQALTQRLSHWLTVRSTMAWKKTIQAPEE